MTWNPEAETDCPDDELLSFTMTNLETGEPMTFKYRPLKVLVYEAYPGQAMDLINGISAFGPLLDGGKE